MNRLVLKAVVGALAVVVAFGSGHSHASGEAERFVGRVAMKVLDAANKGSTAQFRAVLRENADLTALSKVAAGRHSRGLTAAGRTKLVRTVERIIAESFTKYSEFLQGERVEVIGSSQDGRRTVQVTTKIVGGELDKVKWKLVKTARGYSVVDINISGLWLSAQVRSRLSFNRRNARDGVVTALAR